ncbi:fimbria/pilus outer membrane usher protein [Escherichia coli]|nr:fimbria/pilus outer membrane usher protein [Escherichia coli]
MLIAAPGAENTRVANSTGLKTDWRGYTVVPMPLLIGKSNRT